MTTLYLAGPMSGLPQFNFPAFHAAAAALRAAGHTVISPAETDPDEVKAVAMQSTDGKYDAAGKVGGETWGDMLARDVKQLADGVLVNTVDQDIIVNGRFMAVPFEERQKIDGIAFLSGWQKSRGARLEAFVGTLTGKTFFEYDAATELVYSRSQQWVMRQLFITEANMLAGIA